jgi:type VI secretion system protein ImpH
LLKAWVINYCGTELLWDVQLVLSGSEVPEMRLGQSGRLGWTIWLKACPKGVSARTEEPDDVDDLILTA